MTERATLSDLKKFDPEALVDPGDRRSVPHFSQDTSAAHIEIHFSKASTS